MCDATQRATWRHATQCMQRGDAGPGVVRGGERRDATTAVPNGREVIGRAYHWRHHACAVPFPYRPIPVPSSALSVPSSALSAPSAGIISTVIGISSTVIGRAYHSGGITHALYHLATVHAGRAAHTCLVLRCNMQRLCNGSQLCCGGAYLCRYHSWQHGYVTAPMCRVRLFHSFLWQQANP